MAAAANPVRGSGADEMSDAAMVVPVDYARGSGAGEIGNGEAVLPVIHTRDGGAGEVIPLLAVEVAGRAQAGSVSAADQEEQAAGGMHVSTVQGNDLGGTVQSPAIGAVAADALVGFLNVAAAADSPDVAGTDPADSPDAAADAAASADESLEAAAAAADSVDAASMYSHEAAASAAASAVVVEVEDGSGDLSAPTSPIRPFVLDGLLALHETPGTATTEDSIHNMVASPGQITSCGWFDHTRTHFTHTHACTHSCKPARGTCSPAHIHTRTQQCTQASNHACPNVGFNMSNMHASVDGWMGGCCLGYFYVYVYICVVVDMKL